MHDIDALPFFGIGLTAPSKTECIAGLPFPSDIKMQLAWAPSMQCAQAFLGFVQLPLIEF
jgi:hypothetical protein